jgi:ABC-2 type transport system ATP-binding protein
MADVLLKIQNITKTYKTTNKTIQALKGVSFDIYQGEVLSLLGVNGAGKSTLSSIIATLHPATSGDILFKNNSIYDDLPSFRMQLGYCPQKPNLNPYLTLEQNLFYSGRSYGMDDDFIQDRISLLAKRFGLENYLQQKAAILSGGYKQRFMIARSMIHNPAFIILDEPTVGLDPHIRISLWSIIKELKNDGITVLLTTHYLDEAEKLSDRLVILDQGLVKLIDTPDKLIAEFKEKNLEDVFIKLMNQN